MFKTDTRFFDEMAKAATGAVSAVTSIRQQIQSEIKTQINRFIVEMDFVPREDFEIVESLAKEARLQNASLEARIAELEKRAGIKPAPIKAAPKKAAAKKVAAKKVTAKKTSKKTSKKK